MKCFLCHNEIEGASRWEAEKGYRHYGGCDGAMLPRYVGGIPCQWKPVGKYINHEGKVITYYLDDAQTRPLI